MMSSFTKKLMGVSSGAALLLVASHHVAAESIQLDTISVTVNKTEEKVIETLAAVSVVNREEIERRQANRLSEILSSVPGVNLQEDGDDPASVINIRGLQDFGRVNVMVEGARQNFQRSGHGGNGQVYLEPELVRSVDVTRGPVATIYGSGAIGGVVNFGLLDPSDYIEPGETWALGQKFSFDTNRSGFLTSTTLAAQPIDEFGVLGNVTFRDDGNYTDGNGNTVDFTAREILTGLLKGRWQLSSDTDLQFTMLRQNFDYTSGLTGAQQATTTKDDLMVARLHHAPIDNRLVDLTASVYFTNTDTDQTRLNGPLTGNERFFTISTFGVDVFNTSIFDTGAFEHKLTYGGDYFEDTVRTLDPGGNGDEFTPSGSREAWGAFIQDQISFGGWLDVIAALRYDGYNLDSADGTVSSGGDRLSPKITVGVTPVEGFQVYGTYAEGYRAPSVTETLIDGIHPGGFAFPLLPNPDLVPETAETLEAGVNLAFDAVLRDGDRFRAKANYFHTDVSNFIGDVFRPCFPGPGSGACPFGDFQYQNIAAVELYGFEVEATYDFVDGFLQASYTNTTGNNLTDDEPLGTVYPHRFVGVVGWRLLDDALTVGARWTSVAAQTRVPAGNPTSEAHDLFDLFASYEHNRHFSAGVTLKNITDEQYVPYRQTEGIAAPGFAALLTATIKTGG